MKKIFFLMMTLVLSFVIVSCQDEVESCPPIFEGFQVIPAQPHPGDSITIIAKIKQKGSLLYGVKYTWSLKVYYTDETTDEIKDTTYTSGTLSIPTNGEQYEEPTYRFGIPSNAVTSVRIYSNATVNFSAEYQNSAVGPEYQPYKAETSEEYFGSFTSSASTQVSRASGSGSFRIYAK